MYNYVLGYNMAEGREQSLLLGLPHESPDDPNGSVTVASLCCLKWS